MATQTKFDLNGLYGAQVTLFTSKRGWNSLVLDSWLRRKVNVKGWKRRGISRLSRNNFTRYPVFKVKDSIKEPISMATDNRN